MKTIKSSICFILIIFITTAYAQENIIVTESLKDMSKGKQNGFSAIIPQTKLKDVSSSWKKYLKQKGKSDYKEINDEYVLHKTVIPEISSDSIIIYTLFNNFNDTATELNVFLSSHDSVFFSSSVSEDISTRFKTFVRNFSVNEYRNAVQDELEGEKRKLTLLEEELKNLEKENDRSESKMHANERLNERIKDDIKGNLRLQELKTKAINEQQQVVGTYLEKSDLKKEEEKKLKTLEKEKRKLQDQNEELHKDIEKHESENKSLQKSMDKNNADIIPAKKVAIENQKRVVADAETKLRGIK